MVAMTESGSPGLRTEIERCGYYPDLMYDSVQSALGAETVVSYLVHQETTLDEAMDVRRHVTVLVLTPSRLLVCHTDEYPTSEGSPQVQATTTAEAVPLARVGAVAVTTVVPNPAEYRRGRPPEEVTLSVGWGTLARVDLEPATCGDEQCEADHGYSGTVNADDLSLRVSQAGDGEAVVAAALAFATALSQAAAAGTAR